MNTTIPSRTPQARHQQYLKHKTTILKHQKIYYQTHKKQRKQYIKTHKLHIRTINLKNVKIYRKRHTRQCYKHLGTYKCPICNKPAETSTQARLFLNTNNYGTQHITFRHYITYHPRKCYYHYLYSKEVKKWFDENQIKNPFLNIKLFKQQQTQLPP